MLRNCRKFLVGKFLAKAVLNEVLSLNAQESEGRCRNAGRELSSMKS